MFFVVGITWISEVISFLLNYGFAYQNGTTGGSFSVHTNATLIKASIFFDCINAFQGIIMFCVLFFDAAMVKRIGNILRPRSSKTTLCRPMSMCNSMKKEKNIGLQNEGNVKFDHHEQQLTIRTNRTWRTPSPQPSPGLPSLTTQVEVTEEYCRRESGSIPESNDTINGGIEVARIALKTQSGNCSSKGFIFPRMEEKSVGPDHQVTMVDFTMQFP